jgi:hypothetical protein
MPHLSPPTLTETEQRAILQATAANLRDHFIYSLALGTGLRLAEIVGLNVGDVFAPDGTPRSRVRIRPEIAKGGPGGDGFNVSAEGATCRVSIRVLPDVEMEFLASHLGNPGPLRAY